MLGGVIGAGAAGNFANQLISKGSLSKVDPAQVFAQVFTSAAANAMGGLGFKLGDSLLKKGGQIAGKFLGTAGKEAAAKAGGSVVQKGLKECFKTGFKCGVGATTYDITSQVASGKGLTDIDWKEVGASAAIGLGLGMGAKALSNSKIGQKINSASESVGKKLNSAGEKIGEKLSSGLESLKETGSALATDNGGFASDELMFGKRLTNKLHGDNQTRTIPQQLTREGKTPTIGKMKDLNALGAVSDSEFKVADYLPDKESPKANWKQNSGILRSVMNEGTPIKDTSMFPMKNAGFLGAERNLLRNQGWKYTDGYWHQNH